VTKQIRKFHGFTLIELLIVVAIIAILAAIAVPNFLEAQVRSKVSRTKADMRSFATAMEAYAVDYNGYPNCHRFGITTADYVTDGATAPRILERLSTPVAYLTSVLIRDPFLIQQRLGSATAQATLTATPTAVSAASDQAAKNNSYIYQSWNSSQRYTLPPDSFSNPNNDHKARAWLLHSCGPDGIYFNLGGIISNDYSPASDQYTVGLLYDTTNGTVSFGSIFRTGGAADANPGTYAAGQSLVGVINRQ